MHSDDEQSVSAKSWRKRLTNPHFESNGWAVSSIFLWSGFRSCIYTQGPASWPRYGYME
jgi:hypothetical protein